MKRRCEMERDGGRRETVGAEKKRRKMEKDKKEMGRDSKRRRKMERDRKRGK